jgi:hypothetical protein
MGLNLFPTRRIASTFRLPLIQHPGERIVDQLQASMMTRDSLRAAKTTSNRKATGPLPAVQVFIDSGPGYPNTPESMASGLRARNAGRLATKTRGQSAGP